jgi:hypothetical protein
MNEKINKSKNSKQIPESIVSSASNSVISNLTVYSSSEMPIITDDHFWIINIPKANPFIWTKIIRYNGDLLKDTLRKKNPEFEHYNNTYQIGNFYFQEAEKLPKGLLIKKAFVSEHMPSTFIFDSLTTRHLRRHL